MLNSLPKDHRLSSAVPRVTVVIPTYNYARYVPEAVESVLAQSFDELEVVVVDDGSTDETADILRPFDEQIRYIRQEHRGLAATARNTGIRAALGRHVAFLDSDDLWLPEKVSLQVARLDSEPAVGLVYGEALLFHEVSPATVIPHSRSGPASVREDLAVARPAERHPLPDAHGEAEAV